MFLVNFVNKLLLKTSHLNNSNFKKLLLVAVLTIYAGFSMSQTTIVLSSVPANTPPDDKIFIAGDFNQWNPGDANFELIKNASGKFSIQLLALTGVHEFKFTRGSWEKVETDENGHGIANRSYSFGENTEVSFSVAAWEDLSQGAGNSTASENVYILDVDFHIPQLDRTRRIWIYLPPGYDSTNKTYPVVYMHDGQNLFDNTTSFAGEWRVDETLNSMAANKKTVPIVVGIDNGGSHRIDEYCPWLNPAYGGGEGDDYIRFIKETLKPFIDHGYRTQTEAASTCIFGSSLGGLISQYAALKYPGVFGLAGDFSPAFWINQQIFDSSLFRQIQPYQKFYLMGGDRESQTMVPQMQQMKNQLIQFGVTEEHIKTKVVAGGQHNEYLWSTQFGEAIEWFFNTESPSEIDSLSTGTLYPVPATEMLNFFIDTNETASKVEVLSVNGNQLMVFENLVENSVDISALEQGVYFLRVFHDETSFVKRFVKL